MCPEDEPPKVRKTPSRRSRPATIANYRVMRWLDVEREEKGLSLRDVAKSLGDGYRNASRVSDYFHQRRVAGPDMVRRLAIAVKASPITALWMAGHFSAVLDYLDKLYRLGWAWVREDKVGFDQRSGVSFFDPAHRAELPQDADLRDIPPSLASRYHQGTFYNMAGVANVTSTPKPIACAVLLGVGIFSRRGDKVCPEAEPFIEKLSFIASNMLSRAEIARVPVQLRGMRKLLDEAAKILLQPYDPKTRLAIAGEYVHSWLNSVDEPYANFARLALYCQGGFVGELRENEDLWQYQSADIPAIDSLRLDVTSS